MKTYETIDGDAVDAIALRVYGRSAGATEAIYRANPGLADRGPLLPAGLTIRLPTLRERPASRIVRIWG